tara:strand:+ start:247 stop:1200 length:954 start_codon:yes stop_codon:yes gene_type:complete
MFVPDKKLISFVIPCFNEEDVIQYALQRITNVINTLDKYNWEVIFIDDGSIDRTRAVIQSYIQINEKFKLIGFSRNFGHQCAVQAGLDYANGDAIIIIDADLQDPPELASEMLVKWQKGYHVIYGKRHTRLADSFFKRITAALYYRILSLLSEISIPCDVGDFRLIDRKVVDAINKMPEKGRFIRGLVSWAGFRQTHITYTREARIAGKTKYSLRRMIAFALEGITSFSLRPLRIATYIGVFSSALSTLGILYVLLIRLFTNSWVQGWATLALITLFSSSVQLICLGILGEYIGKIYTESKRRPLYFVDELNGFNDM